MEYPKSSQSTTERSRCIGVGAIIVAVLAAPGCARETIGLGLEPPDSSVPMTEPTASEPLPTPVHIDAEAPPVAPTATQAPSAPEPVRLPRPIWVHDSGITRPPKEHPPPPAPEADAEAGCRSNADCSIATQFCRLDTGKCVRCLTDLSCPAASPHCDQTTNECGCNTAADCRFTTGTCDALTHQCLVGCMTQAGCNVFAPICADGRNVCVQCMADADCHGRLFLGVPTELCRPGGLCVQCREEADCADSKRHCALRDGACVECTRSEHCSAGQQCFDERCVPG